MSIQALTSAMALRGVSPSEKLLLLALSNYADENMRCYPSQRRLTEDTGLSLRTIRSTLAALEARGLIARQQRDRPDGSRASDVVTLNIGNDVNASRRGGEAMVAGGGEAIAGGVRQPLPGGEAMVAGLTTFEPSPNRQSEPSLGAKDAPAKKRGSRRAPESWSPAEITLARLATEGFTPGDLERALTRMRDHEYAKPHTDWDAAFRNWVRLDADRKPRHERHSPDAKLAAKQANYARAWEGSERASRFRGEP